MASQTTPTVPVVAPIKAYSYIRFSTPEQQRGDSLRRQLEASIAYADEHGLVLDDQLNLRDLGVSAFRRANVEKGKLGAFIKAVEDGLVAPGSYLLVESLDRLSRAQVMDAFEVFLAIVNSGITIVTLMDKRAYSRETMRDSPTELIISIIIMTRAYEESATKSDRRRQTWNQQKRKAETIGHKITRKLPFWLRLPDPAGEFVVLEEAAAVVRRVFELARAGLGYHKIAQALNADGVPSPAARSYTKKQKYEGNPRTWATSSIGHLLHNEAVIGNLTMEEATVTKLEAAVPSRLDGYYPQIIDDELFYAIQGKRHAPKGKSSALKTNLFTGLLFCAYCQGPMQVDTNTKNQHRTSRIICQRKRRGIGCQAKTWPYEQFEEEFFTFVNEVTLDSVTQKKSDDSGLVLRVESLRGRLAVVTEELANIAQVLKKRPDSDTMLQQLEDSEKEKALLIAELATATVKLDAERNYQATAVRSVESIRKQIGHLRSLPPDQLVETRYALAERIASIVKAIGLVSAGDDIQHTDPTTGELLPRDEEPSFSVELHNGVVIDVAPRSKVRMALDMQKGTLRLRKNAAKP
jgi:DNA invertase Pin-like site-specific DNA recombinase